MDKPIEDSAKGGLLPLVFTLGGFFLFVAVVAYFWLDRRPETVAFGGVTPEARVQLLRELQEREAEMLNQYGWIDRNEGVVRLPIARAMELSVDEINRGGRQN